jgi:hypothetical protein
MQFRLCVVAIRRENPSYFRVTVQQERLEEGGYIVSPNE